MRSRHAFRLTVVGVLVLGALAFAQGVGANGPGPVSWWRAEGNANDSVDGNSGTLANGAGFAPGQAGQAFSFDGVDDHVRVAPAPNLVLTTSGSIEAWILPTRPVEAIILNKEGEYEVARFPDGSIRWAFANSIPGWTWINSGFVAAQNQWTHLVVTYDNGTVKTYANGSLVHTFNGAGSIGDFHPGSDDLIIGGRQLLVQYFSGLIDEAAIYNNTLTASEVAARYAGGGPTAVTLASFEKSSGFGRWTLIASLGGLAISLSGAMLWMRRKATRGY